MRKNETKKKRTNFSFQIANAHSYGAIGAILYSDPADYAMEGGEEENTYPNKAWLPASGVQRGSLYTMPGSGDPQTPGIAALTGMYRRPHNESELPPIPAHPMGYGDAIKFLQEMSGNRLGKKYMKFPNINHTHTLSSACVSVFNRVLAHVLKYTSSHAIALLCNFSETQSNRSYFFSPS